MALKPAGKAMLIIGVVAVIGGGIVMSGALDKIGHTKQSPVNGDGEVVKTAPMPQVAYPETSTQVYSAPTAPAAPAPQPAAAAPSNQGDALDALIRQSGKK